MQIMDNETGKLFNEIKLLHNSIRSIRLIFDVHHICHFINKKTKKCRAKCLCFIENCRNPIALIVVATAICRLLYFEMFGQKQVPLTML